MSDVPAGASSSAPRLARAGRGWRRHAVAAIDIGGYIGPGQMQLTLMWSLPYRPPSPGENDHRRLRRRIGREGRAAQGGDRRELTIEPPAVLITPGSHAGEQEHRLDVDLHHATVFVGLSSTTRRGCDADIVVEEIEPAPAIDRASTSRLPSASWSRAGSATALPPSA